METSIAINFFGPSNSGKTTLSEKIGELYNIPVIKSVAREVLEECKGMKDRYSIQEYIFLKQMRREKEFINDYGRYISARSVFDSLIFSEVIGVIPSNFMERYIVAMEHYKLLKKLVSKVIFVYTPILKDISTKQELVDRGVYGKLKDFNADNRKFDKLILTRIENFLSHNFIFHKINRNSSVEERVKEVEECCLA